MPPKKLPPVVAVVVAVLPKENAGAADVVVVVPKRLPEPKLKPPAPEATVEPNRPVPAAKNVSFRCYNTVATLVVTVAFGACCCSFVDMSTTSDCGGSMK